MSRRVVKGLLILVLGLALLMPAFGAGKILIGLAAPNLDFIYNVFLFNSLKDAAAKAGVDVLMMDAANDASKQLSEVQTMLSRGVDAVIIEIVDTKTGGPFYKLCKAAKVPLVGLCREFPENDVYIGSDSADAGTTQMQMLAKAMNRRGNIGILMGFIGNSDQVARTDFNKKELANYPNMKVVREDAADWDRAKALSVVQNWISSGIKLDGISANNDEMAIGAILAYEAAGKPLPAIAGIDAIPDALKLVKEGKLKLTLYQNPIAQGQGALDAALKLVKGQSVPKKINIPFEPVTVENIDQYLK